MPNFCFRYNHSQNGNVDGVRQRVYEYIDETLLRSEVVKSTRHFDGPSVVAFHVFIHTLAIAVEGRFEAGAFLGLHHEQLGRVKGLV